MSLWIALFFIVALHLIFILVLNFFHVFHCLFNDQISGGTKIFWMAIIFLVPFVGSLFYAQFCSKSSAGKNFALINLIVFGAYILAVFYFSIFGLPEMGLGKEGVPLLSRYFKESASQKERSKDLVENPQAVGFKRDDRAEVYIEKKNLDNKKYSAPTVRLEGVGSNLKAEQWRSVREAVEMLKLEVNSGWTDDEKRVAVEALEYYNFLTQDDFFSSPEYKSWMQIFEDRKSLAPGVLEKRMGR